jgi:erythromycin esterase
LNDNSISVDKRFIELTETFFKNTARSKSVEIVGKSNLEYLIVEIDKLLKNDTLIQDKLWTRFLESYKSYIMISTAHKSSKGITAIRDSQMAKNLDFLVKTMPEKKFIVWLHNAHMIKDDYSAQPGQTMGFQFVKANPNLSYHIAFSSIHMPYRKPKWIEKYSKDKGNLLHFLPTTEKNYFIDAQQIIRERPEYEAQEYDGMFIVENKDIKTNWFKHYDALVFISKGEDVKFIE